MWTVRDFVKCYEGKQLIKPRIQRIRRWKYDDNRDYIQFLNKWRESAMPFLLNERIIDSQKVYYLFDGNNRANAILDFIIKPLFFFPDLIPPTLGARVQQLLLDVPLSVLTKPRYSLGKLYREFDIQNEPPPTEQQDEQFEEMLVQIDGWKFMDIHLSMTIKQNLTDDEMCSLYTSINKGGKVLSKQELMASITFPIKYTAEDLPMFFVPFVANMSTYYGDMTINEKLNVEQFGASSLTLFEVLVAFQMYLADTYTFVPSFSGEEDKDVVFTLYEYFGGPMHERWDGILNMLQHIDAACRLLAEVYETLYDGKLMRDRRVKLKKFAAMMIIVFIIYNLHNIDDPSFVRTIRRICLYHDLVYDLPSDELRESFAALDSLRVPPGIVSKRVLLYLRESQTFAKIPTAEDVMKLIRHIHRAETHYTSTRKARLSRVKVVALSAFFNFQVPSFRKAEAHEADHIIPYSTKRRHTVDVCRLGNLQLIPDRVNRIRQNKPITDRWVQDNELMYQCYPSGQEYETICKEGILEDAEMFNEMCERREELYFKQIARLL